MASKGSPPFESGDECSTRRGRTFDANPEGIYSGMTKRLAISGDGFVPGVNVESEGKRKRTREE